MISLLGLILNTLGAFVILIPDIPALYRLSHRFPPFRAIESGEKQLYYNGELRPQHSGFEHISKAFFSGSPPLSDTPRLDEANSNPAMARIGDTELKSDKEGFEVKRILRNEGDTISDSTYTVELYSKAVLDINSQLAEVGVETPNPYISMDSAQGAFPEYIDRYKRRVFFRSGAILLLIGFALQAADEVSFNLIQLLVRIVDLPDCLSLDCLI